MADEQIANEAAEKVNEGLEKIAYREKEIRNPFSVLVEKLCSPFAISDVAEQSIRRRGTLRIALVSMSLFDYQWRAFSTMRDVDGVAGLSQTDQDACKRQLVEVGDNDCERMLAAFKEALTFALQEKKADIVCVSELGLPSRGMLPLQEANDFAYEMSQKYGALIIAGTIHDSRTLYNTAFLFYPGGPKTGRTFHKGVSAVSVGEKICTPSFREVPVVEIFGLKIATMICLDVADFASMASIVQYADRVDIILVPCLTFSFEKMKHIAKVTSRALRGLVILVNVNQPETVIAYIARFGNLTSPSSILLEGGAVVSMLDEDIKEFEKTRILLKTPSAKPHRKAPGIEFPLDGRTAADDRIEWLFGIEERPRVYR